MHTAQLCFDGILLFIEQDVGTHLHITESHIIYSFSCLFIMIMMKCNKGHKFIICCIVLHQWNFIGTHFSMLKISVPEVLLSRFLQCEKFQNMELCIVVFCMFHTKYQSISLESFLPIYQTMIHYKQSKAYLVFSYFHQFLELAEKDANPWALQLCLVCQFMHSDIKLVVFSAKNSQTLL